MSGRAWSTMPPCSDASVKSDNTSTNLSQMATWSNCLPVNVTSFNQVKRLGVLWEVLFTTRRSTNITRQVLTWNPKARERGGDQKTPGGVTSRQTSSKQGMAGNNWRGLPKTGGAGEMLWMAYAPGGVKGLSK